MPCRIGRGTMGTGRRGKRWEANTVALIKSRAAFPRNAKKKKLLAAIYLRALTDPYSFRDHRRSVEGMNACAGLAFAPSFSFREAFIGSRCYVAVVPIVLNSSI